MVNEPRAARPKAISDSVHTKRPRRPGWSVTDRGMAVRATIPNAAPGAPPHATARTSASCRAEPRCQRENRTPGTQSARPRSPRARRHHRHRHRPPSTNRSASSMQSISQAQTCARSQHARAAETGPLTEPSDPATQARQAHKPVTTARPDAIVKPTLEPLLQRLLAYRVT